MIYKFDKNSLTYKKVTGRLLLIMCSTTLILSLISSIIIIYNSKNIYYISDQTRAIVLTEQNEFSLPKLKSYIEQLNIKYPDIVIAQAQLESANFTSPLFKENNNMFGMRLSNGRPSTSIGINNGYCMYHSWKESVEDYALYSSAYLGSIQTESQYLQYLKQNYAEDSSYVNKVQAQMLKNKL